tara:strand:+ start:150 stop:425 length:276 start_codon:yes stop_codon:yes gene_type:complete
LECPPATFLDANAATWLRRVAAPLHTSPLRRAIWDESAYPEIWDRAGMLLRVEKPNHREMHNPQEMLLGEKYDLRNKHFWENPIGRKCLSD